VNILVLMGGSSAEREISLKTGAGIVAALRRQGHHVLAGDPGTGRLVTGERLALEGGGEKPAAGAEGARAASSERLPALAEHTHALLRAREASDIEVVFIALHGGHGEDGTMQALLELAGKPYTGSGPLASGLAMDKVMAKRLFVWAGVPTPEWVDLPVAEARALGAAASPVADGPAAPPPALERLGGLPIVVKPVDQGSTIGVSIVQAWSELPGAVEVAAAYGERVLIERYIPGRELAIGILGDRALPVVEIEPTKGVYDYECKYTKGMSRYTCPARLEDAVARRVEAAALGAFRVLGCADFGRIDVRLDPGGHPHVLEVNTIPGMTETSLLPMAARALGLSYEALVERMCELALARHRQGGAARSAAPGMSGAGAAVAASRV
jgi:D-alanine-D-alanine ligase